jgi:single-strand DNA-binding protein
MLEVHSRRAVAVSVSTEREGCAMNETNLTIRGNLVADPERITSTKGDFTTFRVAVNEFYRDQTTGSYVDGRSSFFKVVAYRALGANAHKSLSKGTPVLIHGILRINQWQTANGDPRSTPEIEAINLGPDLRFGIATYQRLPTQRAPSEQPEWRRDDPARVPDPWLGGPTPGVEPADPAASASGPLLEQHAS